MAPSDDAAVDAAGDGAHFADGPNYVPSQDACEDGRTIMPLPPLPMQSPSCRDDRPVPGTPWLPAEGACMLPNCAYGTPAGAYGCVNPLDCSSPPDQCRPQGGSSACELGDCVYAACNGATEGQACQAGAGSRGICCAGQCTTGIDFLHVSDVHVDLRSQQRTVGHNRSLP